MLDFTPVYERTKSIADLAEGLTADDLRRLTNEMIDTMRGLIEGCSDEDIVFVPDDPDAYDPAAAVEKDIDLAWTLGHVIVHTTASSEEAAFLAAELARGVPHRPGRSRSEIPWQTVTTLDQCLDRLEESRRMRLASLDMWPDRPYLDNTYPMRGGGPPAVTEKRPEINCVGRFILGLLHDDAHLGQMEKIVNQAQGARATAASGD